jgi:hypothetical protein
VIGNPFDALIFKLDAILIRLDKVLELQEAPPPEWTPIGKATKIYGKGRATLLKAVNAGQITCKREAAPGGRDAYLLRTADLSRLWAARQKK